MDEEADVEVPLERRVEVLQLYVRYLLFALTGSPDLPPIEDMRRLVDAGEAFNPPRRRRTSSASQRQKESSPSAPTDFVDVSGKYEPIRSDRRAKVFVTLDLATFNNRREIVRGFVAMLGPPKQTSIQLVENPDDADYLLILVTSSGRTNVTAQQFTFLVETYPNLRPFVLNAYSRVDSDRMHSLASITNIPVFNLRFGDDFTTANNIGELLRGNMHKTVDGRKPTEFNSLYEGLMVHNKLI